LQFACVYENREQSSGAYDEVEMYVSLVFYFLSFPSNAFAKEDFEIRSGRSGSGFRFHQQVTTLTVCERTAKVREGGQKYEV
jgi:hypothetical protein